MIVQSLKHVNPYLTISARRAADARACGRRGEPFNITDPPPMHRLTCGTACASRCRAGVRHASRKRLRSATRTSREPFLERTDIA
jgi:hypothetical protein